MDENALIEQVIAGVPGAERMLYDTHVDRVYGLAWRMTGDAHLAEDLTQEAFLRIFAALDGFEGRSSLGTWIHAVAVSVIINGLRKVKRYRNAIDIREDFGGIEPSVKPDDPGLRRVMRRRIEALPDILRMALILHEVEGYRHDEIAEMLSIPEGTSRARLSRARAILRDGLESVHGARNEEEFG